MRLLVECLADDASVNIASRLREQAEWESSGSFEGRDVLAHDDLRMVTIEDEHITDEDLHKRLPDELSDPEVVVYLSRHRAESGTPSLTVHPIGNWGEAPFGGRPGTVVAPHPAWAAGLLRHLADHRPEGYEVTLEATHHGPYLVHPTLFLELGSTEQAWGDQDAARVLASAVLQARPVDRPAVLWVGGGHYAPPLTDLVLGGKVTPGHIIAGWAARAGVEDRVLAQAVGQVPALRGFILQRKATAAEQAIAARLEGLGVERLDVDGL